MEIKEILEILRRCTYGDEVYLIKEHGATLLLDYITNLQYQIEHLDKVNCQLRKKINNNIYKSRIEKAVEYIKKHIEKCNIDGYEGKFDNFDIFTKPQKLLNILEGKSDE